MFIVIHSTGVIHSTLDENAEKLLVIWPKKWLRKSDIKLTKKIWRIQRWTFLENRMLKLPPQILRIATGYRARGPNVQLLNSQNEKMQTEFAIARKTWREWIWLHLVFLLQYLLTTASASIKRCFGANAKNY